MTKLESLNEKAKQLVNKEDYAGADKLFQKIISLEPNNPENFYYHAIILLQLNKFEDSENAINQAISLDSDDPEYYLHL